MKTYTEVRATVCSLLRSFALMTAAVTLALPSPTYSAAVELTTVPMATSTATTVKPNLMFVLDDSGSMDWDYMPDPVKNFSGNYGYNTSQCNGVYYNPNVTYLPPVNSTGGPLNATATTFSAAYKDGYNTAAGTTNLNTGFTGGSGTGASGISLTAGPAFYYTYSGNQSADSKKDYLNSNSIFYKECNSDVGDTTVIDGAAVNTRFTLFRLAAIPTTTITVGGAGGTTGATLKITSISTSSKVSSVKVNNLQILTATTSGSSTAATVASRVAAGINACTVTATGNCQVTGYSATSAGATVTIVGPAAAAGFAPVVTVSSGNAVFTASTFPAASTTTVSSITVGGTQLLSANATGASLNALALDIKNKITLGGYSATVVNNIVTVTGPTTASNLTPVMTIASGTMTLSTLAFPESTPAKLQNFANWYSYYSNRMLMMKTGAGLAFANVTDKYRVGFLTMNNNVSPGIVEVNTFNAAQKSLFYAKLYASDPGNSTPLREVLSKVGQYYAHKFGTVTVYKATITVSGSTATAVSSIKVAGIDILQDDTDSLASSSALAKDIADQINAKQVTDFGAKASGNVVTITGPATASGVSPVVTNDGGGMTFGVSAFVGTSSTATLNGITPADPMQYSCQQNFTILSTDGYWNGPSTFDLSGNAVGQVDGTAPRPFNDGAQPATTYTYNYTRDSYSKVTSNCGFGGGKKLQTQPEKGTCVLSVDNGSCTPTNPTNNGSATISGSCNNTSAPSPSAWVLQGTTGAGGSPGVSDTLSDVAMYYYQNDLRTPLLGNCTGALGTSVCDNNVFTSSNDSNQQQHMTTFTLGLGARGRMVYSPSYLTDSTGDYVAVKLGSTASATVCTWQTAGTVCNWPVPTSGAPETIDDLWHAAVNGRGAYFSATDPTSLANGLANALTGIGSKVGAAAAAATSTLNPVAGNNFAYVASYTTLEWNGNLEARGINTDTGLVNENATWCVENIVAGSCAAPGSVVADSSGDTTALFCVTPNAVVCIDGELVANAVTGVSDCRVPVATSCTGTMNAKIAASSDTRTIYTANAAGTALIPFDTAYRAANPTYFDATILAGLSQWPAASDTSAAANAFRSAAAGDNLLLYLRGQWGHEFDRSSVLVVDQLYRNRDRVMGDALESQPAFMGAPIFSYPYPGYTEFKTANASRAGNVYMGTNDGMMHAFAADTGIERWSYIPSMVIPNMWRLADTLYRDKHTNYVNGSPITTDVCTANCANAYNVATPGTNPVWKTILVAGLNGGGRGFYALDVADPSTPTLLWEFTTTAGIGKTKDNDLGYTFGQPVITQKTDGTWVVVVTSGYDNGTDSPVKVSGSFVANSPAGSGKGFLYVLNAGTGAVISKIDTGVGTAAAPSGLAKIAGYNTEPTGNKASLFYGGDLLGNLWRFDINAATAFKFATLFSEAAATNAQPIMTTPQLGKIGNKRVVFIGTGKYLETTDLTTSLTQTQYAIKDDDATSTLVNPRTVLAHQYLVANPDPTLSSRVSSGSAGSVTPPVAENFSSGRGWFVDFPADRERANIDSKLILGTLLVPTIVPSATDCSPGGSGFLNFFDFQTGAAVVPSSGIASVSYKSPIVGINVLYIDAKPIAEVVTSSDPTPTINKDVVFKGGATGFTGKRVLWRELIP